jgi:hypothetical protein
MVCTLTDLPERIASRIDVSDGHWLWTGWCNPEGYPYTSLNGRDQPAYRVVWNLLVGPIPEGLDLDHLCRTPKCCNPEDLEPVTHAENQRRMGAAQTSCRKAGHDWSIRTNVRIRPNGSRYCAECDRINQRQRRALRRSR